MSQGSTAKTSEKGDVPITYSDDNPLSDPTYDPLGSAPFSRLIAQSISRIHPKNGIVIAINGPWGSGKSTVLNFVLHYLQNDFADPNVEVIRFNPWWFPGREDLTHLLISLIRIRLGDKGHEDLKNRLADLSELVSKIPIVPGIEAGEFIAKKLRDQPDLVSLKDRIDELLRSSGKRILVIIDDIDRLTPEEICDLFRTVKAAGNFPNVIYLLAFDTGIVVKSLERELIPHEAGKDYLEKIVQVPFSLPLPDKIALRDLLTGKLNEIIAGTKEENFSTSYWQNMYFLGLD
ncbi:MAG: P-loop NTPase fold protein, partial [Methanotrichaceae archaeon]